MYRLTQSISPSINVPAAEVLRMTTMWSLRQWKHVFINRSLINGWLTCTYVPPACPRTACAEGTGFPLYSGHSFVLFPQHRYVYIGPCQLSRPRYRKPVPRMLYVYVYRSKTSKVNETNKQYRLTRRESVRGTAVPFLSFGRSC